MTAQDFQKHFKLRYRSTSSFLAGFIMALMDAFILLLCIGIGFFIINLINHSWINFRSFVTYWVYLPPFVFVFYAAGLYPGMLVAPQEEVKRFSLCTFFGLMGIAISINVETDDKWPISAALLISWPFATVLLPACREFFRRVLSHFKWWGVPAVIFAKNTDNSKVVVHRLVKNPYYGYSPAIIITDSYTSIDNFEGVPVFQFSDEIFSYIMSLKIKVAIVCGYDKSLEKIHTKFRYLIQVPQSKLVTNMSLHMRDLGGILAFSSTNYLTKSRSLMLKRMIDIILCLTVFLFVLIATLFVAIAIKIDSRGPIFYGHKRVGKNHKEIRCWKFRSMCIDSEEKLKTILATDPVRAAEWEKDRKFTDDPRVTKVGKFLRKTSLDELPQLWNIFVGQMSFVGPRPVTEPELKKYDKYADYVLSVQPGLSGMWQISGRSDTGYEERITLDTYYIQNWSIWLDLWIIIKTVWVVILGKGAY